jgi:2-dehydropantoate 2-reductase
MESHSGWFAPIASGLTRAGWAMLAYDRTGWGGSAGRRGHLSSYRDFVAEASAVADIAIREYGTVHLAGMSWGGVAALYLALRRGWLFDSVHLLAPGFALAGDRIMGRSFGGVWSYLRGDRTREVDPGFAPELFTKNEHRRSFIKNDPLRVRKVTLSFLAETLKMRLFVKEHAGKRRLPPSWCLLAGNDRMLSNDATEAVCRKAGVRTEVVADAEHALVFESPERVAALLDRNAGGANESRSGTGKRIWVIGGGAVGGAVGTLLSRGGCEVGVLVKEKHLPAIRKDGFLLRTREAARPAGDTLVAAADTGSLPENPDLVVVSVKSFDTESALLPAACAIPRGTVLLSLQNGVGNEARIRALLPENPVAAGAICISTEALRAGDVLWPDDRGGIAAAVFAGDQGRVLETLRSILPVSGMECEWVEGEGAAERVKWSKLVLNIGFNALNSVTGLTSAELLRDPEYGTLVVRALREAFQVMRRSGIRPVDLPGYPVGKLGAVVRAPGMLARRALAWQAARSGESAFSMRQDVLRGGKTTEIAELNGVVVERGERFGIDVSANRRLCAMVGS